MKIPLVFVAAIVMLPILQAQEAPGYMGLRIGMSREAAVARALEIKPTAKVDQDMLTFTAPDGEEIVAKIGTWEGKEIVYVVYVRMRHKDGFDALSSALASKYGTVQFQGPGQESRSWEKDGVDIRLVNGYGVKPESILFVHTAYNRAASKAKMEAQKSKL